MAKKLLLALGTLAVLIGGLIVYKQYLAVDFQPRGADSGDLPVVEPGRQTVGGVAIGRAEGVMIPIADPETGLRRAAYQCSSTELDEATGEYVMTDPMIELYLPSGQTVYVEAMKGTVVADEAAGKLVLRRGKLIDAVRVRVDLNRRREDLKAPLDQRPADMIQIRTKQLNFDIDLQELRAPGWVTLDGEDVRIHGSDLLLQWHSAPDEELRNLRLAHGEKMELNAGSALLRGRTGGDDESTGSPPGEAATQPAAAGRADRSGLSAYSLVLHDNVVVTRGSTSMEGADQVELIFSSRRGGGWDRLADDSSAATSRPGTESNAGPIAATVPAAPTPDESDIVVITWDGPLVMLPFDAAKAKRSAPAADEFELHAVGEQLRLIDDDADGPMSALCNSITYVSETRTTRFSAPDNETGQVELTLPNGDSVHSESVRIEQAGEQVVAYMDGPGSMTFGTSAAASDSQDGEPARAPAGAQPSEQADRPEGRIVWTESVTIICAPAANKKNRLIPQEAWFRGAAEFIGTDGTSLAGDRLTAYFETLTDQGGGETTGGRFNAEMAVTEKGELYPVRAKAACAVAASFDGAEIHTDELTLELEPSSDPGGRAAEPVAMTASGNIVLTDTTGERLVAASGSELVGDLRTGRHVITGDLAKIAYGDEWLSGYEIIMHLGRVDGRRRLNDATVVGAGLARILLRQDLSGTPLAEPAPGLIRWTEQMKYTPDDEELVFSGNVAFDSAAGIGASFPEDVIPFESVGDHVRCEELTLVLEAEDDQAATTQPADGRRSLVDAKRKVRSIAAKGGVRLLSRRHDEEGLLTSRVQMTGEDLTWDAVGGSEITIESPGTLSLEDYRAPEPTKDSGDPVDLSRSDRPGITVFQWRTRMHLVQALWQAPAPTGAKQPAVWTARMEGGVMMRHRSGRQILGIGRLPIRMPDPTPVGRIAELDCREVFARFVAAADKPGTSPTAANLTLDLFEAIGEVVFRDGPYEAQGGRIVYNRPQEVAVVYGSELADLDNPTPESDPTPAMVTYEPPKGASSLDTVSPMITVRRVAGGAYRMTALKAAGTGARAGSR